MSTEFTVSAFAGPPQQIKQWPRRYVTKYHFISPCFLCIYFTSMSGTNHVDWSALSFKDARPSILSASTQKHPSSVNIWISGERKLLAFESDKRLLYV